ncbi:MAG: bifunctional NAD pyrophosphatase/5'-nucleotidase, partial [Chryseobacterium sp.]|nr:bifunctional NAD pyrophosphatase/5'-nucleotidase [Chryseobacterium sp.]
MKLKFLIAVLALLAIFGCRTVRPVTAVHIQENISINTNLPEDPGFVKVIAPYKKELESKMNTKIS